MPSCACEGEQQHGEGEATWHAWEPAAFISHVVFFFPRESREVRLLPSGWLKNPSFWKTGLDIPFARSSCALAECRPV